MRTLARPPPARIKQRHAARGGRMCAACWRTSGAALNLRVMARRQCSTRGAFPVRSNTSTAARYMRRASVWVSARPSRPSVPSSLP